MVQPLTLLISTAVCLLRNGADPLRGTKDSLTPIQVAQRSEHGTGLFGMATRVDETEKLATIDAFADCCARTAWAWDCNRRGAS